MALQQYEIVKQVTFSGKFPLILSDADISEARNIIFDVFVSRPPTSPYFSGRTNPPTSFYGTFTENADDVCCERRDIVFSRQRFRFLGDDDQQVIPAMKCIYIFTQEYLKAILLQLNPATVFPPGDYFDRLINPGLFNKTFLFVCYADTALTVVVRKRKFEGCGAVGDIPTPPPPPIPSTPNFPSFPPGTPITNISPDEGFNPGDYEPFPGDVPGNGGSGIACSPYRVVVSVVKDGNTITQTYDIWGEYGAGQTTCELDGGSFSSSFGLFCRGETRNPCGSYQYYPFGGASGGGDTLSCFSNLSIISITPI